MRPTKYAVILLCIAFAAAGCGTSGQNGNAGGSGTQDYQLGGGGAGGPGGTGGPGGPGGSGEVAAVSGSTAQVQNPTGQVAISWTARTTFTQEVATKAGALKVGACVVALSVQSSAGPEQDEADEGKPPEGKPDGGPVAAATVRITAPVDGSCSGGMRRGPGPEGDEVGEPPDGAPGGSDDARRVVGAGAVGKVTAVSGSGFTVESARPDPVSDADSTTSTEVTTTTATMWTATRPATAKAVVVGRCVTSMGRADSTGAIAAESIAVSSPVDGECAVGFGGPRVMERTS